jgi:HEAT repeat protein/ribosomal protein S8
MKPLFSQKFAILTAENPRYGSAEGGNAALEQEMKAKGLKFTPMKGKYGVPENSYLVENPDHQDILSWGKKYGQDSVIVSDGGLHKMVYTNGPHEGLWHEGHSISIHDKEPEDFYSTINLNGKPTHFTIDFDMDTKHGATMKKSLTKMLKSLFTPKLPLYSEYVEPLEKSEKLPHFLKFMGDHPKAQETAQWADDNLKHRNLAELAMRHAKTKPEGLNEEEKTHIKHFNDSLHMPEVQKAAGMLTNKHDFNSGINLLKDAEAAYQKRHAAEAPTLVPMEGVKVLDLGDGVGVYHLPLDSDGKNKNEATAMGHCATPHKGGQLWSIRRDHGNGMVEPLVTISHEGGYIGEMKGKHNWKPSDRHHIHIAKLLASNKIKGFVGGGYAPESNFEISDLKEGLRKKLLEHKPSLTQEVYKETLPRGFQGDYSHVPEIKSIFNTNNLEAQKKYLQKFSKDIKKHIEIRSSVAKHPNTHPDILRQLSTDNNWDVRGSVAQNSNTHPDILRQLSTDNYNYVRSSVAQNPNTHPDILRQLSTDNNWDVRGSVAKHPNTHPDILRQLSTDNNDYVRNSVAKHPNTHPDILRQLSTDNNWDVRGSVAQNSNTHPDILRQLSTDNYNYVRSSVAQNPNTHPDILRQLSTDNNDYVRSSVAQNPNTHPDILRQLSTDNNDYVRSSVAKHPNTHPDILRQLSTDNNWDVRSSVAQNPNTHPDILRQLSTDNNWDVRGSVAQNPNTHPDILRQLSTDNNDYVRSSVAQNPNTHPDILRQLSTDNNDYVRSSVAKHPNTHPDILHKLSTDNNYYVRSSVAQNSNTHPDILRQLSTDNNDYVRNSVAKHPNTHPDILRQLSTDNNWDVRGSVAKHPNTHPDILRQLSTDNNDYVRCSVAKHPNTHPDILHKLSTDNNYYVRSSVAKHPNTHPDILRQLSPDNNDYVRNSVAQNPQFKNLPPEIQQNVRPLIKTNIQKIIAMINDGERNPDAARKATEELKIRREEKYDKILSPEGNLSDIQHLAESHDEDIAKRAREELKRRGLQKSLKKSDSPKHLIHFSTTPNLTTLDPEFQGTAGRHSPETKHGKPTHPRVYFYEEGTPTESVVTGGAKSKYIVKHPRHDKIIDIANDLENQQQAKQQWSQKPIGSMQDAYFKLLKDKGYLGFKNSASALPNVVALFHATPVHAEVPAPKDMAANPDWTKAEIPMSLKKSDVKEAVEKIKGPAKVNEVLSEAKSNMRAKILAALRKEKLAKMNGSGILGAGGATPPTMRPPVPAAPASMAMSKADESESHMAKKDLKDIMEYAQALDKMVVESEDLEDWVDSKITVARQYLSDIAHYLSYEHGQPTEELDKGDVISMKDKKVISTDTKPAPKDLVAQQPKMPKIKRAPVLIQTVKLAKAEEDLEKGDVISMKDKKVISTDTKAAPKELVAQQPKAAKNERALAQRVKSNWEGPRPELAKSLTPQDIERIVSEDPNGSAMYLNNHPLLEKKHIDSIVSRAPNSAAAFLGHHLDQNHINEIVAKAPQAAAQHLNSHPLLTNQHKVRIAKMAPQAASKFLKNSPLEKADIKVKKQEKPTKGMPQAKQLKADADLEKIKEGAENVAKAADKKKSELSKSGYFKEDKKTQLPEWHDPLKQQREEAAKEEAEVRPEHKMHIWAELERQHQMSRKPKTQKPKEELEKGDVVSMKDRKVISTDAKPASKELITEQPKDAAEARTSHTKYLKQDAKFDKNRHGSLFDRGQADAFYGRPRSPHWYPQGTYNSPKISKLNEKEIAEYHAGYDSVEKDSSTPSNGLKTSGVIKPQEPKPSLVKSEELEKGKNYKEQQKAVFGGWKTSARSKKREKQMAALTDMIKRRFGLAAQRAPGKKNKAGKIIDKPNFHDDVVEHIGNPDSLVHEVGHLYQYGKDMDSINPHKEFKTKEQSLSDWQKDMDAHWGKLNTLGYGYKKQAQTAEEYEPMALENYYRRRAGLPAHQKTAKTEEENKIASEKRGKKYKKPAVSRTQAVDDPSKEIVQKVKVKDKRGKEKEIWLTGTSKNLTDKTKELVDKIDRGELVLDPKRGFVQGTSPDAKINIRAREAAKDKTRKDADTLMRSEELEKKLIIGEGKPSKATIETTPENKQKIINDLSAALDSVKIDQSPEAAKGRKMLLEHVKNKLKGRK